MDFVFVWQNLFLQTGSEFQQNPLLSCNSHITASLFFCRMRKTGKRWLAEHWGCLYVLSANGVVM